MSRDDSYADDTYDEAYSDDEYGTYDEEYDTYDEETAYAEDDEDDGSWWDEGAIGLLLIAGVVLFFFPEPFTSAVGMFLIGTAVVAWIIDWLV